MNRWLDALPEHVVSFVVILTLILVGGLLLSRLRRDRASAQRWADSVLWIAAAWLVVAVWPRTAARSDAAAAMPSMENGVTATQWTGDVGPVLSADVDGDALRRGPETVAVDDRTAFSGRSRAGGVPNPVDGEPAERVVVDSLDGSEATGHGAPEFAATLPAAVTTAAPVVEPRADSGDDIAWLLLGWWAAAAGAALAWTAFGLGALAWMRRGSHEAGPALAAQFAALEPPRGTELRIVPHAMRPFVVVRGLFGATVCLPTAVADAAPATRDAVLRHELAHVRRGDHRARRLMTLCWPLLVAHPLAWWLRARSRHLAEEIADELAVQGTDRAAYARQLVGLADRLPAAHGLQPATLGAFGSASALSRRIGSLLDRRRETMQFGDRMFARAARVSAAVLLLGSAVATQGVPTLPQDPARLARLEAENAKLRAQLAETNAQLALVSAQLAELLEFQKRQLVAFDALNQAESDALVAAIERSGADPASDPTLLAVLRGSELGEFAEMLAKQKGWNIVVSPAAEKSPRAKSDWVFQIHRDQGVADVRDFVRTQFGVRWLAGEDDGVHRVVTAAEAGDTLLSVEEDVVQDVTSGFEGSPVGPPPETEVGPWGIAFYDTDGDGLPDVRSMGGDAATFGTGRDSLSVLKLARELIALQSKVRAGESEFARLQPLAEKSLVSQAEVVRAKENLRQQLSEYELARQLVRGEQDALMMELKHVEMSLAEMKKAAQKGRPGLMLKQRTLRLHAQIEALGRALD